ncbi:MAG TPA: CarD family transcriptional regulator, partial [Rickettsiales bacterium]|nr:CarD family transcriptional regulator [Rickettsiales bacterium]
MDYKIKLKNIKESCEILRLNDDAQGFVASLIAQNVDENDIIFVAKNDVEMEIIQEQIEFFAPQLTEKFEILNFLAWDCLPYDRSSPKQIITANRIHTLYKLANRNHKNFIIITSANAILQKIISPNLIKKSSLIIKEQSKISVAQIVDFLMFNGYQRQSVASDSGDFALRGGIVDIVMNKAATLIGYRLDFFGDEIEAIKEFDPITQLSNEKVREIKILPASEVILNEETVNNFRIKYRQEFSINFNLNVDDQLYEAISSRRNFQGMEHWLAFFYKENLTDIFSYLKNPTIFLSEQIFPLLKIRHETVLQYYNSRINNIKESKISGNIYNPIAPNLMYFSDDEIVKIIEKNTNIVFRNFDSKNIDKRLIDLDIKPVPDFYLATKTNDKNAFGLVKEYVKFFDDKIKIFIAALNENSKERIEKLLQDFEINLPAITIQIGFGFQTQDLVIIGEQAIFGEKIIRKKNTNKSASRRIIEEGLSINLGELVVHQDHGIGKFDGIHKIETTGIKTEMLKIIYGGSDILFVPVEDINLITRYGSDNSFIQLDRLGVATWKNRKEKVKNKIKIAAEELIKIAAQRKIKTAPIFLPDQHLYEEFKARFGFVETEDQQRVIEEVEDDLAKGIPMDRLV